MSLIGTTVGRLRITDSLGKGGMGEVFVAFDETLGRRVALKSIRADQRLDAEARARFLREAQILSQLDHPGICRLYELLESEHGDFLVLELIEGQSLKKAMAEGLEPSARLFILERVAEALATAHARGIAHRDLKPDNIMLTDDGAVKVLDFGLASVVDSTLPLPLEGGAREVAHSSGGDQAAPGQSGDEETWVETRVALEDGSPAPVRQRFDVDPEQSAVTVHSRSAEDDTSTTRGPHSATLAEGEIFSTQYGTVMGTLAYMSPEQACGEKATAASDMYSFGLLAQEIFTGRPAYPPGLQTLELLRRAAGGETEPIEGLDLDLQNLLERLKSLAPEARPQASEVLDRLAWIRDKKRRFWRRAAALLIVALLIGLGLKYTFDLRRQSAAAQLAQQEAEHVSGFLLEAFAVTRPELARGRDITAREVLDRGAARIATLEGQPRLQSKLMLTIGQAFRQLGDYEKARPLLERALEIARLNRSQRLEAVSFLDQLASLEHEVGVYDRAASLFGEALEIRRKQLRPGHPHIATSLNNLAVVERARGGEEAAESLLQEALALYRQRADVEPMAVAGCLINLGDLYRAQGRLEEASRSLSEALEVQESGLGPGHPELATSLNNLAAVRVEEGRLAEAESLYRRALRLLEQVLSPQHPRLAASLNNLAEVERRRGRFVEADALYRRALEIQEVALGDAHPDLATTLANLAGSLLATGRLDEARQLYSQSQEMQSTALGPRHPELAQTHHRLADLEVVAANDPAAEVLYRRALEIQSEKLGPAHPSTVASSVDLAELLIRAGELDEAESMIKAALQAAEERNSREPKSRAGRSRLAQAKIVRGLLADAQGEREAAEVAWTHAVELLPAASDEVADLHHRALALRHLGQDEEAAAILAKLESTGWHLPQR